MINKHFSRLLAHPNLLSSGIFGLLLLVSPTSAWAQTASTTGNANPTASVNTNTTGGTNINYQTNNQWSNEMGFGPGIFCRTPTFYVGGSSAQNAGNTGNGNYQLNSTSYSGAYSANVGILVPFGSSVYSDCKRMAAQIAKDREISSDLSMIRACASLLKEGIAVDPVKFPTLEQCVIRPGEPSLLLNDRTRMQRISAEPVMPQVVQPSPSLINIPKKESIKS